MGSPPITAGTSLWTTHASSTPRALACWLKSVATSSASGRRFEVDPFELELAGVDLRKVQHLVDEAEERVRRAACRLQHAARLGLEALQVQQVEHADHAVHGRADFVAHVGQELAPSRAWRPGPDLSASTSSTVRAETLFSSSARCSATRFACAWSSSSMPLNDSHELADFVVVRYGNARAVVLERGDALGRFSQREDGTGDDLLQASEPPAGR